MPMTEPAALRHSELGARAEGATKIARALTVFLTTPGNLLRPG